MKEIMNKSEDKRYDAMLIWDITNTCNFSCPQCAASAVKLKRHWAPEKINLRKLSGFFGKMDKSLLIHITGGEPFCVKNITKALQIITERHYLFIISNLVSPEVTEFAETIDPLRVISVLASAHIMELEKRGLFDTFISHCLFLKSKGFKIFIKEVAYPFRLHLINKYKSIFADYGLNLEFDLFRGIWENRTYPDAFTEEEINLINPWKFLPLSMNKFNRKNMPCNAGFNIAVANNNGKITPCYQVREKLGHIYRRFEFKKEMMLCPFEHCVCPFPVFYPAMYEKAAIQDMTANMENLGLQIDCGCKLNK
jgi:MoaA/NifB/PqqE/SkfB family radical SAM enzyme